MFTRSCCIPALFALAGLAACTEQPAGADAPGQSGAAAPPPAAESSSAPAQKTTADPCVINMGWDPWEPYQYRNVDGELEGLDIELVQIIMSRAGCELRTEEGRWATLLRRLQRGTVDLLTGATPTDARATFAHFSDAYRSEDFVLYVRKGESDNYRGTALEELLKNGFRVGVTEQYVYGDLITDLQEDPRYADQFMGATVGELNYSRLLDLEIDGFLEDPFVAATVMRRKGMNDQIEAYPLEIHSGEVSLMFSKTSVDPAEVERINRALAEIKADGTYQGIIDKYRN